MDNMHLVKGTTVTVEKKPFVHTLVQYPYKLGLS